MTLRIFQILWYVSFSVKCHCNACWQLDLLVQGLTYCVFIHACRVLVDSSTCWFRAWRTVSLFMRVVCLLTAGPVGSGRDVLCLYSCVSCVCWQLDSGRDVLCLYSCVSCVCWQLDSGRDVLCLYSCVSCVCWQLDLLVQGVTYCVFIHACRVFVDSWIQGVTYCVFIHACRVFVDSWTCWFRAWRTVSLFMRVVCLLTAGPVGSGRDVLCLYSCVSCVCWQLDSGRDVLCLYSCVSCVCWQLDSGCDVLCLYSCVSCVCWQLDLLVQGVTYCVFIHACRVFVDSWIQGVTYCVFIHACRVFVDSWTCWFRAWRTVSLFMRVVCLLTAGPAGSGRDVLCLYSCVSCVCWQLDLLVQGVTNCVFIHACRVFVDSWI